jgi:hypothetical protein
MLYRMAFARDPRAEELDLALRFVQGDGRATGEGESADDSVTRWADFAHVLCNAKEFLFIP